MDKNQFSCTHAGFGMLLFACRQRFGITLAELSAESGIPLSVLEDIELGTLRPDKNVLDTLSLFFHEEFIFPADIPANNN